MAETKSIRLVPGKGDPGISRRAFLKVASLTGLGLGGALVLPGIIEGLGKGHKSKDYISLYDDEPRGIALDAMKPEIWRSIVGEEDPRAEKDLHLTFVGGVFLPPELKYFRTNPARSRKVEQSKIITVGNQEELNNNIIIRNQDKDQGKGVLIINPVVVMAPNFNPEFSGNTLKVPAPAVDKTSNFTNADTIKGGVSNMCVAMSVERLEELGVISHGAESNVCFANIAYDPFVALIPYKAEGLEYPFDGIPGRWVYGKIVKSIPGVGEPGQIQYLGSEDYGPRWNGVIHLSNVVAEQDSLIAGQIMTVNNFAEAKAAIEDSFKRLS